jgi:hypothetical protein
MTLAHGYETPYIFGFDATFKKNGYILPDLPDAQGIRAEAA